MLISLVPTIFGDHFLAVLHRERLKDGPHNIVKHQGKVKSCVTNARAAKLLQEQHGSLDAFLWSFAPRNTGGVCVNFESQYRDLPTESNESRAMSKALKKAGFKFVGPTICYAFMQAVGMVVDHDVHCFLHPAATK
jgi:DNA-3-methyladenine glycosylase I